MFEAFHKRGWRGAIGLAAAYALVLQAFLAYAVVSQAAGQGNALDSNSLFALCISHDGPAAADDAGAPVKPTAHCQICTLSATAATLPGPVALPGWQAAMAERTLFISAAACISFHRARAGLSRAPPQNT